MSLSVKIIGAILLSLTIALALIGWLFTADEEKTLNEILDEQGQALAHAIATFSIEPLLVEDFPVVETVLNSIGEATADILSLEVIQDGQRVAGYQRVGVLEGAPKEYTREIAFPALGGGPRTVLGQVRLLLSDQRSQDLVAQRVSQMRLYIAGTFIVMLLVLGVILRRLVLHRVEKLTAFAESITSEQADGMPAGVSGRNAAAGEKSSRPGSAPGLSGDEIGRLSSSLAIMHNAVLEKEALLKNHTQNLESEVSERTRALRVAMQRAESSARAKGVFLANMSHEIRTPMNGVLGFADLLAGTSLTGNQRDYVQAITDSANHLRVILDDILDYSKIEAGRLELQPRPFNLHDVMDATVRLLSPRANQKGLELIQGLERTAPVMLFADAVRVQQVLTNLVDNGIKFTEEGVVSLWVERTSRDGDNWLRFEVADTGRGLAGTSTEHLFEPFLQGDASVTRRFGGAGLGLAISKQLVEQMGGRIGADSTPGAGSLFWFELPLRGQPRAIEGRGGSAALAGRQAWLYEPGKLSRRAFRHTLMRMGLEVRVLAEVGELSALAEPAPAGGHPLLVVGLGKPVDAARLASSLARLCAAPRPPRMVLLANDPDPDRRGAELGIPCARVLGKTVGYNTFAAALEELVAAPPGPRPGSGDSSPDAELSARVPSAGVSVLVVDDNLINLKLAARLLESRGAHVIEASSGEQAVAIARESDLDLILMDIQMPGVSGLDAMQLIHEQDGRNRATPVIAVTAFAYPEDRDRFMAAGVVDCVVKPLDPDKLWRLVMHWTGPRRHDGAASGTAAARTEPRDEQGSIVTKVPGELQSRFLGSLAAQGALIHRFAKRGDLERLEREVHSLLGAAGYFGFEKLRHDALALERALRDGRTGDIGRLTNELEREIGALRADQQDTG